MRKLLIFSILLAALVIAGSYFLMPKRGITDDANVFYTSLGQPRSLDPAFAVDYASCVMVLSIFDTLFQYDYTHRPYRVIPSMLAELPQCSADGKHWTFTLRNDLYFTPSACFGGDSQRVTSDDVVFSFLRLADARLASPGYALFRGRIQGLEKFRLRTENAKRGDPTPYHIGCDGFKILSPEKFEIILNAPEPRLPYYLAMSYTAIVSKKAVMTYGENIGNFPIGSGPFTLGTYQKNYRIEFNKNPLYRAQYQANISNQKLPYIDKIVCYLVQDPQPAWLMFLNGDLDVSAMNKDQMDVIGSGDDLPPAFESRKIRLLTLPELQINYVAFSFTDPRLANNRDLRRAIAMAFDTRKRETYYNGLVSTCHGPILPGIEGYNVSDKTPYTYHLDSAKQLLAQAGYPNGIDPQTKEPLTFTFDLPETGAAPRQIAEMMADDMAKIGIKITPILNSKPKFLEKNRAGLMQLFRFNWVFDYPDAENVFQLFYSENIGGCNRAGYHNPEFDSLYRVAVALPPSPERTRLYRKMARKIMEESPWIFESQPSSFRLLHQWVENYLPHDFAFDRWKYIRIRPEVRTQAKRRFTPLPINAFRHTSSPP